VELWFGPVPLMFARPIVWPPIEAPLTQYMYEPFRATPQGALAPVMKVCERLLPSRLARPIVVPAPLPWFAQ
jgi:hypothetical protein